MIMRFFILTMLLSFQITTYSQTYKSWKSTDIEGFYEKLSLKRRTLGEDGRDISFVFVPSSIKQGVYEVEIADYKNYLYEVKGTGYYVKFNSYFGYAGYGSKGILVVEGSYYSVSRFYKRPGW